MPVETKANDLFLKLNEGFIYSYSVTIFDLIDKVFSEEELDDIRTISKRLLIKATCDECIQNTFTVGAAAFDDKNACTNRIIREANLYISDTKAWALLEKLLTNTGKPQHIIEELNSLNLIGKDINPWDILIHLNSARKS